MFQSVMDPKERRNLGAHYTSEKNILKLIKPLFLDELWAEFDSVRTNKAKLNEFHLRLSKLKFLDPACGCGNFLVITYRELRLLELAILQQRFGSDRVVVELKDVALLNVDAMCGIEYEEFPARIAEVAMWLMDHQMNLMLSEEFGQYFIRLPLTKSAKIVNANALRIDWADVIKPEECSYVLGNPPFIGYSFQTSDQKEDLQAATRSSTSGTLDYVAAWYFRASDYMQSTTMKTAFVSTNSITQGLQPSLIWGELAKRNTQIHFAYRTFKWLSEARGSAHVHVVIIGFGIGSPNKCVIFEQSENCDVISNETKRINGYLLEFGHVYLATRSVPICRVPIIRSGSKPVDNGQFLFTQSEMDDFVKNEPNSKPFFRKWFGSEEFINGGVFGWVIANHQF